MTDAIFGGDSSSSINNLGWFPNVSCYNSLCLLSESRIPLHLNNINTWRSLDQYSTTKKEKF